MTRKVLYGISLLLLGCPTQQQTPHLPQGDERAGEERSILEKVRTLAQYAYEEKTAHGISYEVSERGFSTEGCTLGPQGRSIKATLHDRTGRYQLFIGERVSGGESGWGSIDGIEWTLDERLTIETNAYPTPPSAILRDNDLDGKIDYAFWNLTTDKTLDPELCGEYMPGWRDWENVPSQEKQALETAAEDLFEACIDAFLHAYECDE